MRGGLFYIYGTNPYKSMMSEKANVDIYIYMIYDDMTYNSSFLKVPNKKSLNIRAVELKTYTCQKSSMYTLW